VLLRSTGNPALVMAGENATPEQIAQIEQFYGFDRPLPLQYLTFVSQLAQADFGTSFSSNRVALELVLERMPATMQLAVAAIVLNLALSLMIGGFLGSRPWRVERRTTLVGVLIMQGIPAFVIGLLLIQVFAVELGWLPSIGKQHPLAALLPALTLASFLLPRTIRLTAANVEDAMSQQYVRTARAGGAPNAVVLWRHAIPNALLGTLALIGVQFGFLMGGSLIVETIFAWPGLGLLLVQGVRSTDFPVIQASVFVIATLVYVINAVVDILFPLIDPRLKARWS
jgi:peptide/nickel transport system permease protein